MTWSLMIHGGAGRIVPGVLTPEQEAEARAALAAALDAGEAILAAGGAALDAVEAAVRVLEDAPSFNAGRGACFTQSGTNEMDAAIMDGRDRRAGAVAGTTATRNPVTLARAVMDHSPHVFLAGPGADAFSRDRGLEQAPPEWFATPERRRQLQEMQAKGADAFDIDMKYGTVGAVATDSHGHVAAATSTGGVTGKRWGRIGDSPLIGAGTYADDRAAAISCTGAGEYFIREGVAHEIAARLRFTDDTLQQAADAVLADVHAMGGTGGVIVAAPGGATAWSMTTAGMYRGRAGSDGTRRVALYGEEG
ncbi:isoaspartyl peptidase/L-asparaginase [uncultured Sphingomonas sp.]|uniref:isoaspartyl peptidase/L-asparaginase family protein n=1 Tax=uncultured Sphingomonas sp. TaxID=158754 RepID=UPI002613E6D5|nr:isoaspartyl peptidase/L-asparaginase [uncultured Sphingomonas sp.]